MEDLRLWNWCQIKVENFEIGVNDHISLNQKGTQFQNLPNILLKKNQNYSFSYRDPFIASMAYAFQTQAMTLMVMELCSTGNMYTNFLNRSTQIFEIDFPNLSSLYFNL